MWLISSVVGDGCVAAKDSIIIAEIEGKITLSEVGSFADEDFLESFIRSNILVGARARPLQKQAP